MENSTQERTVTTTNNAITEAQINRRKKSCLGSFDILIFRGMGS